MAIFQELRQILEINLRTLMIIVLLTQNVPDKAVI